MQCMYENRMTPVKNYSKGDSGVRQSNRGGWIWSKSVICIHGNFIIKHPCSINIF
jgi:hypothetical protein